MTIEFPFTRGRRAFTPEEARAWRVQVDAMEDIAAHDPDLASRPIVACRPDQIHEGNQVLVFGPDWKKDMHERRCVMCRAGLVVRPVFKNNRIVVCMACAPAFLRSFTDAEKGANA